MRIIAGTHRGRKIFSVPKYKHVKPISSRIRQSLFDILRPHVPASIFLDLFAGIGTVGLEALSRGARKAVFVEKDGMCVRAIEKNLQNLQLKERAVVLKTDVFSGVEWLIHHSDYEGYDIVFLGPPYRDEKNVALEYTSGILELIAEAKILAKNGLIVAQHHVKEKVSIPEKLTLIRQVKYGDTFLSFLKTREIPLCG